MIDTDPVSPGLQGVHGRYEWRLIGDAVSPRMLQQAGIRRAHRVVAVTGDDVVNSEIVSTVRGLALDGQALDRVDVQVQVEDPSLSRFLEEEIERADPDAGATGARPVVSPFSANAIAAEQLLDRIGDGRPEPAARRRPSADRPARADRSAPAAGEVDRADESGAHVAVRRRSGSASTAPAPRNGCCG